MYVIDSMHPGVAAIDGMDVGHFSHAILDPMEGIYQSNMRY